MPPEAAPLHVIDAVLYGLVQGAGEFLPVSSSTHLTLLGNLLAAAGRPPIDEATLFLLHLPTLAASAWVLRREIRALLGPSRALLVPLALACAATAAIGIPLDRRFDRTAASLGFLGCGLMTTGLVLLLTEGLTARRGPSGAGTWNWARGIAVGIGQALAAVPGLSRLGMSACAGMLTGVARRDAVVFSFLCALPVVAGKAALTCRHCLATGEPHFWRNRVLWGAYPLAALIAFAAGVVTFRWLLKRISVATLVPFGIYCLCLGGLTLGWSMSGRNLPKTNGNEPPARVRGVDPGRSGDPAADESPVVRSGRQREAPVPAP